jgi:hypothetical protein
MSVIDILRLQSEEAGVGAQPIRVLGFDLGTTNSTVAEIFFDPTAPDSTEVLCLAVEQRINGRSH